MKSRDFFVYLPRYAAWYDQPLALTDFRKGKRSYLTVVNPGVTNGDRVKPNPLHFYGGYHEYGRGNSKGGGFEWRGQEHQGLNFDVNDGRDEALAYAYQIALAKLSDNVRGSTDASVDAFQLRQTLALGKQARTMVSDLGEVLAKLRRVPKIRSALKLADVITNAHLAYIYGIRPTLSTMYDIAKFDRQHYVDRGTDFTGRNTQMFTRHGVVGSLFGGSWPVIGGKMQSRRCEIKVRMCIPDNAQTSAARLASLNPVSIGYELMPWSFVLDWAYNLGGYFRDLETAGLYGLYFKSGYANYTYREQLGWTAQPTSATTRGFMSGLTVNFGYNRIVLLSYPAPNLPRLKLELGASRLLAATSLGYGLLRSTGKYLSDKHGYPVDLFRVPAVR